MTARCLSREEPTTAPAAFCRSSSPGYSTARRFTSSRRATKCGPQIGLGSSRERWPRRKDMTPKLKFFAPLMIAAALLTPSHSCAQQTGYKLVDIGTLGGPVSYVLPAAQIGSFSQLNAASTLA